MHARSSEQVKYGVMCPAQLKNNGAPTGLTYIDTKGYAHLRVLIHIGTTDIATTAAPSLVEGDTTSPATAITGAALAAAIAATADDTVHAIDVDLTKGRKRYIKCLITAGNGTTGTNLAIIGILSQKHSDDHDGLATDAGLTELVSV
jgi:hypothetical protein